MVQSKNLDSDGRTLLFFTFSLQQTLDMKRKSWYLVGLLTCIVMSILIVIAWCRSRVPKWNKALNIDPFHGRTVVLSYFYEDVQYLAYIPADAYTFHVYVHGSEVPDLERPNVIYHPIPNAGSEALAYVEYIVTHYDSLPQKILFLHAHATSWHQKYNIVEILQLIDWNQDTPYCSVNRLPDSADDYIHITHSSFTPSIHVWSELFQSTRGELPPLLEYHCCAQFVATRDTLRSISLDQWTRMQQYLIHDKTFSEKDKGVGFERLWKLLFTHSNILDYNQDICRFLRIAY